MRAIWQHRWRRRQASDNQYAALRQQVASQILPRWQRWLLWGFGVLLLVAALHTPMSPALAQRPLWWFVTLAVIVAGVTFAGIILLWHFLAVVGFDRAAQHATACADYCERLRLTDEQVQEVVQQADRGSTLFSLQIQLPLALIAGAWVAGTTLPLDQTWQFILGMLVAGMLTALVFLAHNFYINTVILQALPRYQGQLRTKPQLILPYGENVHAAVRRYVSSRQPPTR